MPDDGDSGEGAALCCSLIEGPSGMAASCLARSVKTAVTATEAARITMETIIRAVAPPPDERLFIFVWAGYPHLFRWREECPALLFDPEVILPSSFQ